MTPVASPDRRDELTRKLDYDDYALVTDSGQISRRGIEGAPTLLVEVLSPSNRPYDRVTKARRYAAAGVPHYWIVDPELRSIDCYRLGPGARYAEAGSFGPDDVIRPADFPDMVLELATIWRLR